MPKAFDRLNNPLISKQGLGYLSNLNSNQMTPQDVDKKRGILKGDDSSQPMDDSLLMPPPRVKSSKVKDKQNLSPESPDSPDVDYSEKKTKKRSKSKSKKDHSPSPEPETPDSPDVDYSEKKTKKRSKSKSKKDHSPSPEPETHDSPDVDYSKKKAKKRNKSKSKTDDSPEPENPASPDVDYSKKKAKKRNKSKSKEDGSPEPESPASDVDYSKKKSKKSRSENDHKSARSSERIKERDIANSASTNVTEYYVENNLVDKSGEEELGIDTKIDRKLVIKIMKRCTEVNPEKVFVQPTFALLNNPLVLKQGLGYLCKLNSNEMTPQEVDKRLGILQKGDDASQLMDDSLLMPPPRVKSKVEDKQNLSHSPESPDSHDVEYSKQKAKKHKKSKSKKDHKSSRSRCTKDFEENDLVDKSGEEVGIDTKIGRKLVRKLMKRCTQVNSEKDDCDEEETNSQPSGAVANFISGYTEKKARYNNNAELIKNLTEWELIDNYEAIRSELRDIFDSKSSTSERHNLFLEGWSRSKSSTLIKENTLKDLNISIPFTGEHAMILISCLNEYLLPKEEVPQFAKYISYVMLPEAFIRIYGRLTNQTYAMAELEMRYGACYDDSMLG